MSNQANLLQSILKEINFKLQSEIAYFKPQIEKLKVEKKQLIFKQKSYNKSQCVRKRLKK